MRITGDAVPRRDKDGGMTRPERVFVSQLSSTAWAVLPRRHWEADMICCPWCSTLQVKAEALLGKLGWLTHYRCRYCGGQFAKARP
jgi:hypothetical protein